MLNCPNKNDPRWSKMVDMLGEDKAYYYFNLNEGFMSESGMLEILQDQNDLDDLKPIYDKLKKGLKITSADIGFNPVLLKKLVRSLPIVFDTKFKTEENPDLLFHGSDAIFPFFDEAFLGNNTQAPSAKQAFFATIDIDTALAYGYTTNKTSNVEERYYSYLENKEKTMLAKRLLSLPIDHPERIEYAKKLNRESNLLQEGAEKSLHVTGNLYDQKVYPLFFRSKNPMVVDVNGDRKNIGSMSKALRTAKEEGYDAVLFKNVRDGADITDVYTVFSSAQIENVFDVINEQFVFGDKEAYQALEDEQMYYSTLKQYSENELPKELESEIPLEVWNSLSSEEQTKIINCL